MDATRDANDSTAVESTHSGYSDLVDPLDSLSYLMTSVLASLNRENELESTLTYLHSEWLSTEADLREAVKDEAAWNALKIPSRLKIAIKNELRKVSNSNGRGGASVMDAVSTPTTSNIRNTSNTTTITTTTTTLAEKESPSLGVVVDDEKETLQSSSPITPSNTDTADKQGDGETLSHEDKEKVTIDATRSWIKCFSPEHCHYYYYNEVTEASEWNLPEGVDEETVREDDWSQQTVATLFSKDGDSQIVDTYIAGLDAYSDEEAHTVTTNGTKGTEGTKGGEGGEGGEDINLNFISQLKLHTNSTTASGHTTVPSRLPVPSAPLFLDEMSTSTSVSYVETIPSVEATPVNSPSGTMAFTEGHAVRAMPLDEYYTDNGNGMRTEGSEESYEGEYVESGEDEDGSEESNVSDYDDTDTNSYGDIEDIDSSAFADVPIDPSNLQMLMDMGFPEEDAALCLQRTDNDITDATSLCLLHQKRREQRDQAHDSNNKESSANGRLSRGNSAQSSPSVSSYHSQHSPTTSTLPTASQYIARLERADTIAEGREGEKEGKKKKTVRQRLSKIASKVLSGNLFSSSSGIQGTTSSDGGNANMSSSREPCGKSKDSEENTTARPKTAEGKGSIRLV